MGTGLTRPLGVVPSGTHEGWRPAGLYGSTDWEYSQILEHARSKKRREYSRPAFRFYSINWPATTHQAPSREVRRCRDYLPVRTAIDVSPSRGNAKAAKLGSALLRYFEADRLVVHHDGSGGLVERADAHVQPTRPARTQLDFDAILAACVGIAQRRAAGQ